jgi:hypothetical protein
MQEITQIISLYYTHGVFNAELTTAGRGPSSVAMHQCGYERFPRLAGHPALRASPLPLQNKANCVRSAYNVNGILPCPRVRALSRKHFRVLSLHLPAISSSSNSIGECERSVSSMQISHILKTFPDMRRNSSLEVLKTFSKIDPQVL